MMHSRSVVIRRNSCRWTPQTKTKIKTKKSIISTSGFVSPMTVAVVFAVFSGLLYIYSINQSAVKGYQIRKIEKEIAQMRNENDMLKIREAELRSFYKIEETSKNLNMSEAKDITYVEGSASLALLSE